MKWVVFTLALAVAGCLSPGSVTCKDGSVCPEGSTCVAATSAAGTEIDVCIDPDQLAPCSGLPDRAVCTWDSLAGTCHGGACVPDECGNRLQDSVEACDDGNNASEDGCSADCGSTEVCGNSQVDTVTGEECDKGDPIGHDGCASSCRLETPIWQELTVVVGRSGSPMTYDARRQQVITFGGYNPATNQRVNDTRVWEGDRWTPLGTPVAPPSQNEHQIAFDGARGETVLFGGSSTATWLLDATGWHVGDTTSAPPSRSNFGMVYDGKRERVIAFGGFIRDPSPTSLGDTWEWDGESWMPIAGPGPMSRLSPAMAYDPKRGVTVVFGGLNISPTTSQVVLGDLWELDGTTWTQKTFTAGPSARWGAAAAWDPVRQRVLVVGGGAGANQGDNQAWEWDGATWTPVASVPATTPGDVFGYTMATDHARGRVVLQGAYDDTYEFDGTSWVTIPTVPVASPGTRVNAAAALDPRHREIVLYGGATTGSGTVPTSSTVRWNGSWIQGPTANAPPARQRAGLVYDPIRDEMILFGGEAGSSFFADTHAYRRRPTPSWTPLSPPKSPSGRTGHAMAWDGVRGRVLVFGGAADIGSGQTGFVDETWSWDGATWMADAPATKPSGRIRAAMAYDPVNRRVVLFGGIDAAGVKLDDTWLWNGTTWTELATPTRPSARESHRMAWDPARRHVVLFGGYEVQQRNDAWELVGDAWKPLPVVSAPSERVNDVLVTSPDGAGVMMIGGLDLATSTPLDDTWRLRWDSVRASEEVCTAVDTDGDGLAGCADPDCAYRCTPLCAIDEPNCMSAVTCGDAMCDRDRETCGLCPADCGACAVSCGDSTCDVATESVTSCPGDCK